MKIGAIAKYLGMPPSTIRYYEKKGLITPQRVGGHREFDAHSIARLQFIQLCQAAGFSISEILDLLARYGVTNDDCPWQPAIASKRKQIRDQLVKLQQTELLLNELNACRCQSLEQCVAAAVAEKHTFTTSVLDR